MSANNKLLSLVIPTYNRSGYLDAQMEWAVNSINGRWDAVELVICDNASPDDTAGVCDKWSKLLGDKLRVFRNVENVGLVRNCLLGLERAVGDFVWLIGDDDPLLLSSTEKIISVITKHNSIGMIHINHRCVSSIDGSIITPRFYSFNNDIYAGHNGAYYISQLLENNNTGGLMFITANVLNRKLALSFIDNNPPQEDMLLVYPVLLNAGLAVQYGFYFISDCLIDCAYYASSWLDKLEQVQHEAVPKVLIKLSKMGVSNKVLNDCLDFQFKSLDSLTSTLYKLRKSPLYIMDRKFINWVRRRMLKLVLKSKLV